MRFAKEGEQFVDLMDATHILTANDIVIADDKDRKNATSETFMCSKYSQSNIMICYLVKLFFH